MCGNNEGYTQTGYYDQAVKALRLEQAENRRLTAMNARMLKVLTKINDEVMPRYAPDQTLEFDHRSSDCDYFDHGEYCGFTWLANIVGDILLEKPDV